jgi:hypothetical protein
MTRVISYSEVEKALTCQAAWDFRYGDQLAGSSLKQKNTPVLLSNGKAWGAMVAAWHQAMQPEQLSITDTYVAPEVRAECAMAASLHADAKRQVEVGAYDLQDAQVSYHTLSTIFEHYASTIEPLALEALEAEYVVPVPSRRGVRRSTKYRLQAFVDGRVETPAGTWLVEFKLRGQLTPARLIQRSRQIRWYAWAHREATGQEITGVWVDETLNEAPRAPRIVNAKRKGEGIDGKTPSHAKDQYTTPEWYIDVCEQYGVGADPDTIIALDQRRWHQRVPIVFTGRELDEAGRELTAAAHLIGDLDTGERYPLRNAKRTVCNFCQFNDVCDSPREAYLVDQLFDRLPAKRDRPKKEELANAA